MTRWPKPVPCPAEPAARKRSTSSGPRPSCSRRSAPGRRRRPSGAPWASTTASQDEEILKAFEEAGYDRETVQILHLVPILQVAWVDGEISKAERAEILKIAAARNVVEGTPVHAKLLSWLDAPPSPQFFERTMEIISRLLELFPEEKRASLQSDVMTASLAVASASGGFLGFGSKVSADEKVPHREVRRGLREGPQGRPREGREEGLTPARVRSGARLGVRSRCVLFPDNTAFET